MDSLRRSVFSLFPAFLAILVYGFIFNQVELWIYPKVSLFNSYNIAVGVGAIFIGFLSDSFCRRKVFLWVHIAAPILLLLVWVYSGSMTLAILFGLLYNPLSTIRANLVDNEGGYSKLHILSFSFVFEFFPDTLYVVYERIPKETALWISMTSLLVILALGYFVFFDRRDQKIKEQSMFTKLSLFGPQASKRALFTLVAFIPTQVILFVGQNSVNGIPLENYYSSLMGFAFLMGALFSSLYPKTPHISILTIGYGLGLLFMILPLGALFIYGYHSFNLPYMFTFLCGLMGFYLAFVYDVVLRSSGARFRGTICGILDFIFWGGYLITLEISKNIYEHISPALILGAVCFLTALILQKKAETTPG